MRETIQQLEAEARAAELIKKQKEQYPYKFTADHAERLAQATYGGYYTNPEITASVGLSDTPIDTSQIHINSQRQALAHSDALRSRENIPVGTKAPQDPQQDFSLADLLRIAPQEMAVRKDHQPDWWDKVDPTWENGLNWRSIPVPAIKDASELMNLQEVQVVKLYMSKTQEEWDAIPGMIAKDTINMDGTRTGKFDARIDLPAKFKTLENMMIARAAFTNPDLSAGEKFAATLIEDFKFGVSATGAVLGGVLGPVPKVLGFFAPDHIGPAGGIEIESAGITVPTRISVKDIVGKPARATTKAIGTGFLASAQLFKNSIEYKLTHQSGSIGTFTIPMDDWEDYQKTVIEGNILTQIIKQAVTEGSLDVGKGFFPEGKALEEARKAHDAGLPKIDGRTWTLGNYAITPLVQEGYIDRNGYIASVLSGVVDGVFTAVTDPSLYGDPVKGLMKIMNLERVAATTLLEGRAADIVYEQWRKERSAAGLSTEAKEVIDMPWGAVEDTGVVKEYFGMLPAGSKLPEEAEAAAQAIAKETIGEQSLVHLDSPPAPVPYKAPGYNVDSIKRGFGLVDTADGRWRFEPTKIDEMPFTRDGVTTLNKLASFDNPGELYDYFLGNIPVGLAVKIQDAVDVARAANKAVDPKEIHTILKEGVLSGDPFYNIREAPGVMKSWATQTGPRIAQWSSGSTRQFAMMPNSTFFSFDDPLASIKDMNRLMNVMKVPKKERYEMLSKAMKTVANGEVGKRFELADMWMDTVVRPSLSKNGVPDEWIKGVTQWSGWSDGILQWTWDAIGDGYPASWFAEGSADVVRSTDFMMKGFMMVSPENLKQVIRETTNLWKVFQQFRGNPAMEALLRPTMFNALEKIQVQYMKPVALGAPLPIKMVTKILPEELLRVAVTEGISISSLYALGALGHVNMNTFGVAIKSGREIQKIMPQLEHLDDLYANLRRVTKLNDVNEIKIYTQLINTLEAKYGKKEDLLKQVRLYEQRLDESLPGSGRKVSELAKGLMADERAKPGVLNFERQTMRDTVTKDIAYDMNGNAIINPDSPINKNWVKGTARDIVQMADTPEYREVAKAMLAGGSDAVIQLPNRFLNGDLKDVFDAIYAKALRNQGVDGMNKITPLTSMEGNSSWVYTIYNDILTRTGADRTAIGAIATGKLGTESISSTNAWKIKTSTAVNVYEPTKSFNDWVRNNLLQNTNTSSKAPFARTEAVAKIREKERLFTRAFGLYRYTSAKYARGPFQRYHKWQRIIELMPAMDPKEAAAMVAALEKSDAADWLQDSIRAALPRANGTITRKQVELLGEMHGHQRQDEVLYNYENRSYFGSRHSILFGFFDAWKEQWAVWARLLATNPATIGKGQLLNQGLEETELPEWAGGQPGRGILFTDEDTGQQAVALPFSREVYSMFGLNAEERIQTKNLTMVGSAVPGFFGFGSMIMDSIFPKSEAYANLRATVFPFGDPAARSQIADYLVPMWGQGLTGAISSRGRNITSTDLFANLQALGATETNDNIRASTLNAVLTNIASNADGVPVTAQEREKIIEDAINKTDLLISLKSFFKILLPGASMTKYFTQIGAENVTTGVVMDDLRMMTDKSIKSGGTYTDGVAEFLGKYGPGVWIYLAGGTDALPGLAPTKEFAQWQTSNRNLLDKYPLVAGYLGPQDGEFDVKAYSAQSAVGLRKPRDIEVRQEKALNSLAWTSYNWKKEQLIKSGMERGFTPEQVMRWTDFKDQMKLEANNLKQQFPMWNPAATSGEREREITNQIVQIERMITDKKVLATPGGKILADYWTYRTAQVNSIVASDPSLASGSWRKAKAAIALRQDLTDTGYGLAEKYPEFAALWENVLSREFEPPEIGM
jgi:hypothetical protein